VENAEQKPLILAVDDSAENLQVLSALLKDHYRVKIAKSGEKALEIAQQEQQPDLILLDIVMPEMDGFTACEKLKSNPITQKIPVIFLTALNEVADETRGFKVGGADFIIKPFNPDIVMARINTHIALQAERRKSESLLRILLPDKVITDLIVKGKHTPEIHKNVSILFCDFVGFTTITILMCLHIHNIFFCP
jgi:CheY-like chemotaxis protein